MHCTRRSYIANFWAGLKVTTWAPVRHPAGYSTLLFYRSYVDFVFWGYFSSCGNCWCSLNGQWKSRDFEDLTPALATSAWGCYTYINKSETDARMQSKLWSLIGSTFDLAAGPFTFTPRPLAIHSSTKANGFNAQTLSKETVYLFGLIVFALIVQQRRKGRLPDWVSRSFSSLDTFEKNPQFRGLFEGSK